MRKFLLYAVVATLFAACSKDAIEEQAGMKEVQAAPDVLYATMDEVETRTQLNSERKTTWTFCILLH